MTWLVLALACTPEDVDPAPSSPPEQTPVDSVPDPDDTDTAVVEPVRPGIYPPAPYDCAAGVPDGVPAVRELPHVRTTEGLAFALDGSMVAEQTTSSGALIAWTRGGHASQFSPGVGTVRGLGMAGNGDVLIADGILPKVWAVTPDGQTWLLADLPASGVSGGLRAAAEVDGAADGTLAAGTLYGGAFVVQPDGEVLTLGQVGDYGMGAAFSVDESRVYFSAWTDTSTGQIFVSDRTADGGWTPIQPWATLDGAVALSGMTVDACDNVYAIDEGCTIYRISPDGVVGTLMDLDDAIRIQPSSCRTLAFGRGLGGWDAYRLYATTYDELAEIDVGVPGRPR